MVVILTSPSREAAIRREIREYKANRKRSTTQHDGHNKKVGKILVSKMERGKIYTNEDLGVVLIDSGFKYSSVGPVTSYLVREDIIERVERGKYRKLKNFPA